LSLAETLAVRLPSAESVKVTVMEQLAPALTVLPQVFVSAKSSWTVTMMLKQNY
jgi:hypothetical protein